MSAEPAGSPSAVVPVRAPAPAPVAARRVRARVIGTVQGVGFRPYVYRLAGELGLAGWVLNDAHGVLLEVEGPEPAVDTFLARLAPEAPPLARVEQVSPVGLVPLGERGFVILPSPLGESADAPVAPDTATCAECLAELTDPGDRRHRYPFINCTNCGPRFSIVRGVPYDRRFTTMAGFTMCPQCQAEYEDPTDRRFHAQPNACPVCGPRARLLWLDDGDERDRAGVHGGDPVAVAAAALRAGRILGIKGIGGFHLACRADDETAVRTLRARKHREDRPFALMVASVADATELVELDACAVALLSAPERPIVLAPRRVGAAVAASVAPGLGELGVMLAYSPLHHLLLADVGCALVMTSANVSDEPIAFRDADAIHRLTGIADGLLTHDRPIETRTDDSVLRVVELPSGRRPLLVRRSRGYVPVSLELPREATRPILACGAELKSTFCLARGGRAWLSHHIGDLANAETLASFEDGIEHFRRLFAVGPEVVAHDLHPEYLSTKYAVALADAVEARGEPPLELVGVQHHHAHLAACLAEHGETGPALGVIFDGSGDGGDGTLWGGELLLGDLAGFRRVGALTPVHMPGGERAIHEPWRMACAWLTAAGVETAPAALIDRVDPRRWTLIAGLARSGLASPVTTSMGRLFDAAAALCGLRTEVSYEGQAAIELEAACDPGERGAYEVAVGRTGDLLGMDPSSALLELAADAGAGVPVGIIAARFHAAVARATVQACVALAGEADTDVVVLAGGVFLNRRLLEATAAGLDAAGLRVLVPERLPPGDGAIAYGQAAVAAWRTGSAGVDAGER